MTLTRYCHRRGDALLDLPGELAGWPHVGLSEARGRGVAMEGGGPSREPGAARNAAPGRAWEAGRDGILSQLAGLISEVASRRERLDRLDAMLTDAFGNHDRRESSWEFAYLGPICK